MKTCLLFPHVTVDVRMRRVYAVERKPFPGPNCGCESCCEKWMSELMAKFKPRYVDNLR